MFCVCQLTDKSQDCNVRMLIQEGHAGFIIGKSGARIKELRLVVIDIFLRCSVSVCHSLRRHNIVRFVSHYVMHRLML